MGARRKHSASTTSADTKLARYRKKRDFSKTPEPKSGKATKTGFHYLVQKHAASRLHYDFRLELDGVLKSWAVTRGPSLDPHDKRLAVEVEDHPVSYGAFEGIIPKGQYGGGTVMLWDEGSWEPIGDPHEGLAKGKLEFKLHGKRLSGEWTLVRMRDREKDKERHNWLLIKRTDKAAKPDDHDMLLNKNATSIISGRTMVEIANDEDRVWQSDKKTSSSQARAGKKAASKSKLPAFKPPQLVTLTDRLPQGKDWVHEIKFDGYRAMAYIQNAEVTIYTRNGKDWTHKFQRLADKLAKLPVKSAILDGEIVALDAQGTSSFKALQNALSTGHTQELQYYVFDILYLNGKDLKNLPLLERKAQLPPLFRKKAPIFYSEHFSQQEESLLNEVCRMQMEGLISKRASAPYEHRRSTSWLKTKCHKRQEFVIGGFTLPAHADRGIGALLLGYYEKNELIYAGKVGTGFDHRTSLSLRKKLDKLQGATPFKSVPAAGRRGAKWVKPKLVCEVEFTEWTEDGHLRHPSFQGLREDKPATDIFRDRLKAPVAKKNKVRAKGNRVGGITITHPDRILYPGTDISKEEMAEYYFAVADHILPHVKNRPLSMIRCPEGLSGDCFFQRHIARGQSPYLHPAGIAVKGRDEDYLMIKDKKGLVTLVQWGVIELHPWGCLADKPELPDRMIFDLDPDPVLPFAQVIEGAKEVSQRMEEFGLESFVKTTGGKGLHVVIPMSRSYGWDTIKSFAQAVAYSMQHDNPRRYIAKSSKKGRKGKIFVDYLRNDLTSTAVAAFSVRARNGAPVAMPVAWEELKDTFNSGAFSLETVPGILKKRKTDPWQDFHKIKQKISAAHLRALRIDI